MDATELVPIIREWVRIDNEAKELQRKQTALRAEKRATTAMLVSAMKTGGIDRVALATGDISYSKTTVRKPLTQKSLAEILAAYYDNDAARVDEILGYIMDNRATETRETISRRPARGDT
jgi:hypothetical protein